MIPQYESMENEIRYDQAGLVPVIAQDFLTGEVLMLAYANREAVRMTLATGEGWYYSRERRSLWRKGETSGNAQSVHGIMLDCDGDALIYLVRQKGNACHTGRRSCFRAAEGQTIGVAPVLHALWDVVERRKKEMPAGSYVAQIMSEGLPRAARKVGEEAVEFVAAVLSEGRERAVDEMADLIFHCLVALSAAAIPYDEVLNRLLLRMGGRICSQTTTCTSRTVRTPGNGSNDL